MSDAPKRSFIARCLFPPRRFFASPPGTGRGFAVRAGGGSCHFSIFFTMSSCMLRPVAPDGSSPNASTLAMSAHFPATKRAARVLNGGGVFLWIMSHWKMNPTCISPAFTCVAVDIPAVVFLFCPNTCTLFAGIFDSCVKPPATPSRRAATSGPSTALRFGAVLSILLSTSATSFRLSLSSVIARSHASNVLSRSSLDSGSPFVVLPVTDTTMIVAEGMTLSSSTFVMSISFPIALTTRA
eukprot:30087-Pelagococcus_subviridis.AAC.24